MARSVDARDGLSRRARKAAAAAKRKTGTELIAEIGLGEVAPHFQETPMNQVGAKAIPQPDPTPTKPGPQPPSVSANDQPSGRAPWFRDARFDGPGTEIARKGEPKSSATKIAKAPSLADAISTATDAVGIGQMIEGAPIVTGLPGDDYTSVLDEMTRPPNTY